MTFKKFFPKFGIVVCTMFDNVMKPRNIKWRSIARL